MIVMSTVPFYFLLSSLGNSAPVRDLKDAILKGKLGGLNPLPWAIQTGNCLGWCIYAFQTHDAFLLASNLPGLMVSLWLNMGAVKLQFVQKGENAIRLPTVDEVSTNDDTPVFDKVMLPQESILFWVLVGWSLILIWVGWISPGYAAAVVGIVVNINLIFFFGAPLQALVRVVKTQSSDCIHVPSMVMTVVNTSFWFSYGIARHDPVIYVPNSIGLSLGLIQCALCLIYPTDYSKEPISPDDSNDDGVPKTGERDFLLTASSPEKMHTRHGHRRYYSTGNIRVI
jgi:solute carrier family 50 protein (sugar transporter)